MGSPDRLRFECNRYGHSREQEPPILGSVDCRRRDTGRPLFVRVGLSDEYLLLEMGKPFETILLSLDSLTQLLSFIAA